MKVNLKVMKSKDILENEADNQYDEKNLKEIKMNIIIFNDQGGKEDNEEENGGFNEEKYRRMFIYYSDASSLTSTLMLQDGLESYDTTLNKNKYKLK